MTQTYQNRNVEREKALHSVSGDWIDKQVNSMCLAILVEDMVEEPPRPLWGTKKRKALNKNRSAGGLSKNIEILCTPSFLDPLDSHGEKSENMESSEGQGGRVQRPGRSISDSTRCTE